MRSGGGVAYEQSGLPSVGDNMPGLAHPDKKVPPPWDRTHHIRERRGIKRRLRLRNNPIPRFSGVLASINNLLRFIDERRGCQVPSQRTRQSSIPVGLSQIFFFSSGIALAKVIYPYAEIVVPHALKGFKLVIYTRKLIERHFRPFLDFARTLFCKGREESFYCLHMTFSGVMIEHKIRAFQIQQ